MTTPTPETPRETVAFTPGPWRIGSKKDGRRIVAGHRTLATLYHSGGGHCRTEAMGRELDAAQANARLIAAAPDLYEAAAWALEVVKTGSWTKGGMDKLRAALARVRGDAA